MLIIKKLIDENLLLLRLGFGRSEKTKQQKKLVYNPILAGDLTLAAEKNYL
jgi:hypothetical protein